jgi:16S rRNA (guanine(966)-N(2))-methyltransferase RsmD
VRILAGAWRGRVLEVSRGIRPTGGRAKEALLSRWQETIPGCSFLDLFAGCGAVGLEAASRGAHHVVLVERNPRALRAIIRNCISLEAGGSCQALRGTLPALPAAVASSAPFQHVFADPPYDFDKYSELLERVAGLLGAGGELAIEHARRVSFDPAVARLRLTQVRDYGESRLSFYGMRED